jgi:hypothetical protein
LNRLLVAVVASVAVACTTQQPVPATNRVSPKASAIDPAKAADAIRGSTKAEVDAAFGPAAIVRFDSGYEVWVYRFVEAVPRKRSDKARSAPAAEADAAPSELVLLFNPAGVVAKVRIRPPSANPS